MNKKKRISLILFLSFLLINCHQKNETAKSSPLMPAFNLLLLDSVTHLNTEKIATGEPSIFLYFSPDCEHCQKETADILGHMNSLKRAHFYFITNDPFERLQAYNKAFKLYKYSNITLARDYTFFFPAHFEKVAPPYLVIYDQQKHLRTILQGETPVETLISSINSI